jgi:hypothetical protein
MRSFRGFCSLYSGGAKAMEAKGWTRKLLWRYNEQDLATGWLWEWRMESVPLSLPLGEQYHTRSLVFL